MMAPRRTGVAGALSDLAGALVPLNLREIEREIDARVGRLPTRVNEFGFDPYGLRPSMIRRSSLPGVLLYRYYFRTECHDVQNVPRGRVLLVANHAGQLPFDALMLSIAMLLEAEPPRIVRGMGEFWIPRIPWFNVMAARGGMLVGTPENCVSLLEAGECVMVFPEGVRGMNKPFSERYRLQRMGLGFMRLALETDTPIVPVGIVGSEEQQPGLMNLPRLGRLFGMPAFPITLGFPWLGPLGLWPLPVKYHLHFGEPMRFEGTPTDEDASIEEKVDEVRREISNLLERGRRERKGVFH
jgi:1-acyl-sn-glycerol-3-phosphate acyltransferase